MIWESIGKFFREFQFIYFLQIVAFSVLLFFLLRQMRKNGSRAQLLIIVAVYIGTGALILFDANLPNTMFLVAVFVAVAVIAILFSKEIRHLMQKAKRNKKEAGEEEKMRSVQHIKSIATALLEMKTAGVGAFIIFKPSEKDIEDAMLQEGPYINGEISARLIESVFYPGSVMHDGAMIIEDGRIRSAGCYVNTIADMDVDAKYGTRHRAAIGIARDAEVNVIIVSEERKVISYVNAKETDLKVISSDDPQKEREDLEDVLKSFYWMEVYSEENEDSATTRKEKFSRFFRKNWLNALTSFLLAFFTVIIINI